jgi:hypothetical protein
MWTIDTISKRVTSLKRGGAGLPDAGVIEVTAEGVILSNALDRVQFDPGATRLSICPQCGSPSCGYGDCVAIRRLGDRVIWLPAWERMLEGEWEESYSAPPDFVRRHGAVVLGPAVWEELRATSPAFPAVEDLPPIDSREAVRLCQATAPGDLLGRFPNDPCLQKKWLIALTEGDIETEVDAVERLLATSFAKRRPLVAASPQGGSFLPLEFWVDVPGTPAWKCLARLGDDLAFQFGDVLLKPA